MAQEIIATPMLRQMSEIGAPTKASDGANVKPYKTPYEFRRVFLSHLELLAIG